MEDVCFYNVLTVVSVVGVSSVHSPTITRSGATFRQTHITLGLLPMEATEQNFVVLSISQSSGQKQRDKKVTSVYVSGSDRFSLSVCGLSVICGLCVMKPLQYHWTNCLKKLEPRLIRPIRGRVKH